jgi:hypothetical protein
VSVYINGVARLGPAVAEEVTTLPPPSKEQLNKIVKYRNPDNRVSRSLSAWKTQPTAMSGFR